ncbi:MAG: hypothetical protein L6R28_25370 [Planctomycetes bacterium]|nr:hypothetical protein [Planctomycetota bacterium]
MQIEYCESCQRQITEHDLAVGLAVRIGELVYCHTCRARPGDAPVAPVIVSGRKANSSGRHRAMRSGLLAATNPTSSPNSTPARRPGSGLRKATSSSSARLAVQGSGVQRTVPGSGTHRAPGSGLHRAEPGSGVRAAPGSGIRKAPGSGVLKAAPGSGVRRSAGSGIHRVAGGSEVRPVTPGRGSQTRGRRRSLRARSGNQDGAAWAPMIGVLVVVILVLGLMMVLKH